jgi:N-acetylglucosamine-6-phosphate deacetylase
VTTLLIAGATDASGATTEISIVDGVISGRSAEGDRLDASGLTALPGFIDIQLNGGWGHDFTEDPASIWTVGARLPETGVTAFCPTIITSPPDRIKAATKALRDRPDGYAGAEPVGLHIEGPFISHTKRGTHPAEFLRSPADADLPTDDVAIVTVAPELDGAIDLITTLADQGVVVSIGHSAADHATATQALNTGATLGTHLFNAMPPMTGRDPGIAGAILDSNAYFGVIVDGVHLADTMVRLAWNTAPTRFIAITDAISALGMADGQHHIGSITVTVAEGAVRNEEGNLAGSVLTMDKALTNLIHITGAALDEAAAAFTATPAKALGRSDMGSLDIGTRGDVVLFDNTGIVATVVGGRILHLTQPERRA